MKTQARTLGDLRREARAWKRTVEREAAAREQRDDLIRAAAKAGISYRQIAAVLAAEGVSINHQRVGQIVSEG